MEDKEFINLEVGKTFKSGNITLIVKEVDINDCDGCFFRGRDCEEELKETVPACANWARKDKKSVVFKEVEDEI